MTKHELVEEVARRLGVSKARAAGIVDLFFAPDGIIAQELRRGGRVQIAGFGNFEVRRRAARRGRDPRTGQAITIAATTSPAFRAGSALKEAVNRTR